MTRTPHILVVDDHREIRDAVTRYLERNGYRTTAAHDAREMDAALKAHHIDLVVLDVMMPGEDGLSVCRRLRANSDVPILMLTARGEDIDRIVGLEIGADDYLAKPFNPRELLARITAILRRSARPEPTAGGLGGHRLAFDRWVLDVDRQILSDQHGAKVELTAAELRMLIAFLERPRIVLSRAQLLDLVHGRSWDVFDRAVDNQVSRLRRKIEADPDRPRLIRTVRGSGYSLNADVRELS